MVSLNQEEIGCDADGAVMAHKGGNVMGRHHLLLLVGMLLGRSICGFQGKSGGKAIPGKVGKLWNTKGARTWEGAHNAPCPPLVPRAGLQAR